MTPPPQHMPSDVVTLLMGVRNGAAYLPEQLQSISEQTNPNWRLVFSDDGSTDHTRDVLDQFGQKHPNKTVVHKGPQEGFSANFMGLVRRLPTTPGYVGFADQDDIWMPDKLARAMSALAGSGDTPTLYAARSWYWTPGTALRPPSPFNKRPCSFKNALIENVASGNTIVLNPAAASLARRAAERTTSVFAHDWWLYLLITGAGGKVRFDNGPPCLLYRQHSENVIGAGNGLAKQMKRKVQVLRGAFSDRLQSNVAALEEAGEVLTDDNRRILAQFKAARASWVLPRLTGLRRTGVYRQSVVGNVGFWGAATLARI